ncbi:unnamed protein product [Penicillium olsonii]|nr:unnamed protein product [Penicillium olsonii]
MICRQNSNRVNISDTPFHNNFSHPREPESWDQDSQYSPPTPGYFRSPYAARSDYSPSPSVLGYDSNPAIQTRPNTLPLLQESEWDKDKVYDEDPPICLHYFIEWRVTLNNKAVVKDTEEDIVLTPNAYWNLVLEKKLQKVLREKVSYKKRIRVDDSAIVASVNDRPQRDLTKRFNKTDIVWTPMEKQLRMWSSEFSRGKRLTLRVCFNYVEDSTSLSASRKGEKRGKSSVNNRMLEDRDAQLDAEEKACGQQATWRRHYRLRTQTLKRLVTYAEKGGVLETHKDVPDEIKNELHMEEQQRQEKDKRKTENNLGNTPYPPININVLPSHSVGLDATASSAIADLRVSNEPSPLKIPGFRDVAVKEYGEWLASTVSDDTLKAAFRQACNVTLSDGFDLGHIYKDQSQGFFIGKGVMPGIARTFGEKIRDWVENVKKVIPIFEAV